MTFNRVTLIGHVSSTPCFRETDEGDAYAWFSLATHESWRDVRDRQRFRTTGHRVLVFSRPLVEVVKRRLTTGAAVLVEGKIRYRKGLSDEGLAFVTTEIVLQEPYGLVRLLPKRWEAFSVSGSSGEKSACPPPTPEGEKMSEGERP